MKKIILLTLLFLFICNLVFAAKPEWVQLLNSRLYYDKANTKTIIDGTKEYVKTKLKDVDDNGYIIFTCLINKDTKTYAIIVKEKYDKNDNLIDKIVYTNPDWNDCSDKKFFMEILEEME